jgi:predicted nucleic acid-binding protein
VIVVDASALASALLDDGPAGQRARGVLAGDTEWAAPAHLVLEVISVIRSRLRGGKVSARRAADAVAAVAGMAVSWADGQRLVGRVWQLRENRTAYDAAYVALAEDLGVALVTADVRLANAPGVTCRTVIP